MISVVIPLYNKEDTVARALRSVLGQTCQAFEIVVINDGSTDGSAKVVEAFTDPRIRLIHQPNAGVSAARNRGIAEARYDLIAFLDADDEWLPQFLETILALEAKHPECDVFATRYHFQYPDGTRRLPILRGVDPQAGSFVFADYFGVACQSDPPITSSSVAATKQALDAVGGFPVGIKAGEDLLTWARLAVRFEIAFCRFPLAAFAQDPAALGSGRPSRAPAIPDVVGQQLVALLPACHPVQEPSLRRYLGLWHKMRASCFLRLGKRRCAFEEIRTSLGYNMLQYRLILYLGLLCWPAELTRFFFASRGMPNVRVPATPSPTP